MKNCIYSISPYLHNGVWVFDDERVGLVKEPFVAGMPEIFREIFGDVSRFTAIFSDIPFPSHKWILERKEGPHFVGTWYRLSGTSLDGWLCPALLLYFAEPPSHIYIGEMS